MIYEGGFVAGKRTGTGVEYSQLTQNLILYKGEFLQDFRHGKGVEYSLDGSVYAIGIWNYGRKIEMDEK